MIDSRLLEAASIAAVSTLLSVGMGVAVFYASLM
jgi:hypothetical protein